MRLIVDDSGMVHITYSDAVDGILVHRRFRAPATFGYVLEHLAHGNTAQVCEQLAATGSTLMADRETLPAVIRREYRKMRAAERRYFSR